jgi:hypothetical protein
MGEECHFGSCVIDGLHRTEYGYPWRMYLQQKPELRCGHDRTERMGRCITLRGQDEARCRNRLNEYPHGRTFERVHKHIEVHETVRTELVGDLR